MRTFDLNDLSQQLLHLMDYLEWCARRRVLDNAEEELSKEDWQEVVRDFSQLEAVATTAEFPTAFANIAALNARIDADTPLNFFQLETEIYHIRDMFLVDIERSAFLSVPRALRHYLDNEKPFGILVSNAFPSAATDLREAGNCLAADCNTAAVFHLMRAVEWALRALGTNLGFRQLRARKQSGKVKYVPVSHLEWEKIINQLQVRVDKRVEKMRPGKRKQEIQQFYYPVLEEVRAIRDAWRNHVMHSRAEYSAEDAAVIMAHVKRLMVKLASRVCET
jgi:hypothetical protein